MTTLDWVLFALVLAVLVGAFEFRLRQTRRLAYDEQSDAWRAVEASVQRELALPERQQSVTTVREKIRPEVVKQQLNHVCRITAAELRAPAAVVTVIEHQGQQWLAYYGADWLSDQDVKQGLIAPLNTSYCQYVVATEQMLSITDARKDPRVATADERTKSEVRAYLGAPVRSGDIVIGSLCVFDFRPRRWSDRDRALLENYAVLVTQQL